MEDAHTHILTLAEDKDAAFSQFMTATEAQKSPHMSPNTFTKPWSDVQSTNRAIMKKLLSRAFLNVTRPCARMKCLGRRRSPHYTEITSFLWAISETADALLVA